MIEQGRQKGSRRLLAKIAITGALAALPMAVVAAPAFADPAPGVAQADQDWQHNQGQGQDWQHNQGQDWQHNQGQGQDWQHNGDRDQQRDHDQDWQHNGDRDQQRDHDQDWRNSNQWQNWRPDQH